MSTVTGTTSSSGLRTLEDLNTAKSSDSLGKDAFLNILVTQMANQDPLEPASNTEYISQLAQFSALEQMQSLNTTSTSSQAYSLLGKYVFIDQGTSDSSQDIYGRVDGVVKQNNADFLLIGDMLYSMDSVTGVLDSVDSYANSGEGILQSAELINKTITAVYTDEAGTEQTVHGQVSSITVRDGDIFANIGDQQVPVSSITEIAA